MIAHQMPQSGRSNEERAITTLTTYERPYGPQKNNDLTNRNGFAANNTKAG